MECDGAWFVVASELGCCYVKDRECFIISGPCDT